MRIFSQLSRHFPKALAQKTRRSHLRWFSRVTKRNNKCDSKTRYLPLACCISVGVGGLMLSTLY